VDKTTSQNVLLRINLVIKLREARLTDKSSNLNCDICITCVEMFSFIKTVLELNWC